MKATLEDVASASGVSKATASYVLNNKKSSFGLSARTVRKVLEESVRLNYRPDAVAVALAEQRSAPVGVLILSPWLHSQFSDFMVQVSHAIESAGSEMKLRTDYQLYRTGELSKTLKPVKCGKYDAVIVLGTNPADDTFLDRTRERFRNVILLNRLREGYVCSCGNDLEICERMAKRVLAGGRYRKFVLPVSGNVSHRELLRIEGWRKVLSPLGSERFLEVEREEFPSEEDFLKSLRSRFGSEGVCYIFTQYFPAARFLNSALRDGVRIPDSVGVVGYDRHSLLNEFLNPPLTTIDPRVFEMTRRALILARTGKAGGRLKSVITEAEIVEGGSAVLGPA